MPPGRARPLASGGVTAARTTASGAPTVPSRASASRTTVPGRPRSAALTAAGGPAGGGAPSIAAITSPARTPAASAGPPGNTSTTRTACVPGSTSSSAPIPPTLAPSRKPTNRLYSAGRNSRLYGSCSTASSPAMVRSTSSAVRTRLP